MVEWSKQATENVPYAEDDEAGNQADRRVRRRALRVGLTRRGHLA